VRHDGHVDLVHYKLGQDVLQRVDRAFQAFFRRVKAGQTPGYPRFKSRRRYDSLTYINYGEKPHVDRDGKLILQGIGHLKVRWHRPVAGTTKTLTIKREADRWYVCFSVEYTAEALPPVAVSTGLDVGLESFATLSDGTTIAPPRYLHAAEARLRRAQRRVARRQRGSHRRRKAVVMLQRAWAHVRQQRRHFHHVEARTLVDRYAVIAVEDLQLRHLTASAKGTPETPGRRVRQKAALNRAMLDAAWGQFLQILASKAAEAGRQVIAVDARGTSQRCPCGAPNPKQLKDRWHHCATCGLDVPRDHASALEIHRLALRQWSA
jgi:putative transposase